MLERHLEMPVRRFPDPGVTEGYKHLSPVLDCIVARLDSRECSLWS